MYRFDESRVGLTVNERFTRMVHALAVAAVQLSTPHNVSLILSVEEEAERERKQCR